MDVESPMYVDYKTIEWKKNKICGLMWSVF